MEIAETTARVFLWMGFVLLGVTLFLRIIGVGRMILYNAQRSLTADHMGLSSEKAMPSFEVWDRFASRAKWLTLSMWLGIGLTGVGVGVRVIVTLVSR